MKLSSYEMSSFLMYRMIDPCGNNTIMHNFPDRIPIRTSEELEKHLSNRVHQLCARGKTALALSGGIDSAILAKFMPRGTIAYTFQCVVPGVKVTDETPIAAQYAEECGLQHKVIQIYWEDFERYAPILMKHKKAPIHSIEVQIYKACLQAKADGIDTIIFGEAADAVYGGLSNLLAKDWPIGEFIDRYSFLMPYRVLKQPELVLEPFKQWERNGIIYPHDFISHVFINESVGSYLNACATAGVNVGLPYPESCLACAIDYKRIRAGQNKYLVREVFERLFPGFNIPPKLPMPRAVNEWLKGWHGPERSEFYPNCVANLTGDQKWLLWSLEKYLDL